VDRVPQSRAEDMEQLLEARYHHREAGEIDQAVATTDWVCSQLDTWGAYRREEQLYREALTWLPERSAETAVITHNLGIIAQTRGEPAQAMEWYQKSLQIKEELGNRAGMASTLGQMGVFATEQGQPAEAVPLNLRSLAIQIDLGSPQVPINLYWLRRQRELLGEERFGEILREHLSEEDAAAVLGMLEEDSGS